MLSGDAERTVRPHDLAEVEFALLEGVFSVAENGAIWIDGASLPWRSAIVLPDHLGATLLALGDVDPGDFISDPRPIAAAMA